MTLRTRVLPPGWYPGRAGDCRREIDGFNDYIKKFEQPPVAAIGGVIPHAGWYFSGRLAALVMHQCAAAGSPDLVAVFGGHLGTGPAVLYADDAWETPLGDLEIDQDMTGVLLEQGKVVREKGGTNDNTVEIQLPLVKHYFPESRLLALRAPQTSQAITLGKLVAETAAAQGKSLLVFGSTDLTHYGPNYGFAPHGSGPAAVEWVRNVNDRGFIDQTLAMDAEGLLGHASRNMSACSAGAVAAACAACAVRGATEGRLLDYYTSHDIMPGDSFVGYAGILF